MHMSNSTFLFLKKKRPRKRQIRNAFSLCKLGNEKGFKIPLLCKEGLGEVEFSDNQ